MNKQTSYFSSMLLMLLLVLSHETIAQTKPANPNGYNKFYYDNGKLSSEGNLKNGKPEGLWKNYYSTGILKSEGSRRDELLDGNWKFYSEDGILQEEIQYKEGKRNGNSKVYSKEGFLLTSTPFIEDKRSGIGFSYYSNGGVHMETPYENGVENGQSLEYNLQGDIITIRIFKNGILTKQENINRTDSEGNKEGNWKEFYKDKSVKSEGKYRNGDKDGYWKEFTEKGELLETTKFEQGSLISDAEELANLDVKELYYQKGSGEGKLSFRGTYRDGKKHGTHLWFDEEGNIDSAKVYRNDLLIARGNMDRSGLKEENWKEFYYPTGELKATGNYTKGYKTDLWTYYFKDGKLEQKGKYDQKGRPDGTWKWFHPNGQEWREEVLKNGVENGLLIEYSDSGTVISKGEFVDGKEEGVWIDQVGDHREEGAYEYGLKTGVWKHTYLGNDKIKFEGEFYEDLPQGKHVWYYPSGQKMLEGKYVSGVKEGEWRRYFEDGSIMISIEYNSGQEMKVDGIKVNN